MAKKPRIIKASVYVRFDEFDRLKGVRLGDLQESLRQFMSKRGNGKDCASIVRVIPTFAPSNTVEVELIALNEDIDFISETNAESEIVKAIDDYFDVDFDNFIVKQVEDPMTIRGNLG